MDELKAQNKSDHSWTRDTIALNIAGFVFMVIVILTAILSNTLVIAAIVRSFQLRNSLANVFVINLCLTDLLGSVLVLPISSAPFIINDWPFGENLCIANAFMTSFFSFASILSLSFISIERFYSIKRPMHYAVHMTPCRVYSAVVLIWIQSLVFASLSLFSWGHATSVETTKFCAYTWQTEESSDTYLNIVFVFCYIFPGLTLLLMYIGVFRVAHAARLQIHPYPEQTSINVSPNNMEETSCEQNHMQTTNHTRTDTVIVLQEATRRKSNGQFKALKTLMLLFGMYLLLWGPYYTLNLCGSLYNLQHVTAVEVAVLWLGFSSYAINPFLYGWMNRAIREELLKMYHAVQCKSRERVEENGEDNFLGSKEDFLQFLERTTCSTRVTTQTALAQRSSLEPQTTKDALKTISDSQEHHV